MRQTINIWFHIVSFRNRFKYIERGIYIIASSPWICAASSTTKLHWRNKREMYHSQNHDTISAWMTNHNVLFGKASRQSSFPFISLFHINSRTLIFFSKHPTLTSMNIPATHSCRRYACTCKMSIFVCCYESMGDEWPLIHMRNNESDSLRLSDILHILWLCVNVGVCDLQYLDSPLCWLVCSMNIKFTGEKSDWNRNQSMIWWYGTYRVDAYNGCSAQI